MKIEKVENLVASLHDKTEYATHIRSLKQPLNHGLVLKKVHKIIKFLKTWLKSYTDMSKDLLKKIKQWFWNFFLVWQIMQFFEET